jgi:hypothetical protein
MKDINKNKNIKQAKNVKWIRGRGDPKNTQIS